VTGASSGIGPAIAQLLGERGYASPWRLAVPRTSRRPRKGCASTNLLCRAFVDTPMTEVVKDSVPAEEMITLRDIAIAVGALLDMSPACIVAEAQFLRAGDSLEPPHAGARGLARLAVAQQLLVLRDRRGQLAALLALGEDRRLQVCLEHPQLAHSRAPGAAGTGEAVPRTGERDEAGATAVAVRGEHRADAALAVGVRADDDVVRADALQHRLARAERQTVDRQPEVLDRRAAASHVRQDARRSTRGQGVLRLKEDLQMRLGVHIGYWGLGLSSADQLEIVQEAERLGYDSVWTAEAYGSDAATILGWLAGQTSTIKLGSAIFQIPARSAAMTAMTAATLDQLSDGRFLLGVGTSGPQVSEGWHGVRFGKQLARTRDYVAVIRQALARERVAYEGETLRLPLPDGPGKALKLTIAAR
jgi:hypothetical protein